MGKYKLRRSIFGHSDDVRVVRPAVVPEGGFISGSRDKTVKIWKEQSGHAKDFVEMHTMVGATHFVSSLCTLPPSSQYPSGLILAGSHDCAIYGFSLETSQPVMKLLGHSDTVCALSAGAFGTVVSGSWDKTARVWHGQRCVRTLEGHDATVWAVAVFQDQGVILTGSADKTIRLWRSDICEKQFRGHTECVRALAVLSSIEFLSSSNDATIRMWQTNGDCIHVLTGHTNYIYDIAVMKGTGDFVTCSEDRTVRVWIKDTCVQTIELPATTLWSVACLNNGDIAVGGSDGSIRVFTRDEDLYASMEEMEMFEKELHIVNMKTPNEKIGDLSLDELPGGEVLESAGLRDGQTRLINEGETVGVYQWCGEEFRWKRLGDVFDAKETDKQTYEGKKYDFVFSIDVEEKFLRLPFNVSDNPWVAAQSFIDKNNLNPGHLDEIAQFIMKHMDEKSGKANGTRASADFSDPFTGSSRYLPFDSSSGDKPVKPVEEYAVVRGAQLKFNTYYPMHKYLRFDSANLQGLEKKLREFNNEVGKDMKMDEDDIKNLIQLSNMPEDVTPQQIEILDKVLQWPSAYIFPVLDVLRLSIRCDVIDKRVGEAGGLNIANYLLRHVFDSCFPANQMLALRTFCNFFNHQNGETLLFNHWEKICNAAKDCLPSDNKNVQVAVTTLYLNYVVALNKGLLDGTEYMVQNTMDIFKILTESEAIFRMLVTIGTLMANMDARPLLRASDIVDSIDTFTKEGYATKVVECAKLLVEYLHSESF